MKKVSILSFFISLYSISFSQSLQNTEWEFYNPGLMDTVTSKYETDTFRMIDSNDDAVVISWYEEFSDTMRISDVAGYGNICGSADTGVYTFSISNDSLYFSLISDPCNQRASAMPSIVRWRKIVPTSISIHDKVIDFLLYPNPNNGQFIIESSKNSRFELIDGQGKLVEQHRVVVGRNEYQLNVQPGLYLLRMVYPNETLTRKFLVN